MKSTMTCFRKVETLSGEVTVMKVFASLVNINDVPYKKESPFWVHGEQFFPLREDLFPKGPPESKQEVIKFPHTVEMTEKACKFTFTLIAF